MSEISVEAPRHAGMRQGRGMLLLIVAMFALPLLIVATMYQFQWRPGGTSHGQLVSPPQALRLTEMQTPAGTRFGAEAWKGKWSMVYVSQQGCDTACESQLHTLRQVHASLNKEIGRAQRILLAGPDGRNDRIATLQAQYPDLIVLTGPDAAKLAEQFGQDDRAGNLYLVDPLGNLMMRYPPGYDAKGLRKDLMRLLTYSWTG